jgi:hypothetical protein
MKNLIFLCLILLSGCTGHAQNSPTTPAPAQSKSGDATDFTYSMPSGKKAVLKLPFARTITVKTWDKAELKLTTILKTTREEYKKIHTMEAVDGQEELNIKTDFQKDFMRDERNSGQFWCRDCDSLLNAGVSNIACYCLRIDYVITLPVGTSLALESISGDIEIRGHNGPLRAKTISGFVDIDRTASTAATLEFKSVTGEIYTDFDIDLSGNSSAYSKKVVTSINGGGSSVRAESVSGDIYFRKRGM